MYLITLCASVDAGSLISSSVYEDKNSCLIRLSLSLRLAVMRANAEIWSEIMKFQFEADDVSSSVVVDCEACLTISAGD